MAAEPRLERNTRSSSLISAVTFRREPLPGSRKPRALVLANSGDEFTTDGSSTVFDVNGNPGTPGCSNSVGTGCKLELQRPFAGLGSIHMRSSSLARVVMASLGVSVVITLGCGTSPGQGHRHRRHFRCGRSLRPKDRALEPPSQGSKGQDFSPAIPSPLTAAASTRRSSARRPSLSRCLLTLLGTVDVTVITRSVRRKSSVPGGY